MSGAEILLEPGVFPRLLQGLWVTVWTVSYTHLDVYKRQVSFGVFCNCKTVLPVCKGKEQ